MKKEDKETGISGLIVVLIIVVSAFSLAAGANAAADNNNRKSIDQEKINGSSSSVSVTRDLPDGAYPGEEINVSLTQSGFPFGAGKVIESLPEGFEYVLGSLPADKSDYDKAKNNLTIDFRGDTTMTYAVKAGTASQIEEAVFFGMWKSVDSQSGEKIRGPVTGDTTLTAEPGPTQVFDTGPGTYPSISGTHTGTIKPQKTITVSGLYTYPCSRTGGHTEFARVWNSSLNVTATWNGYQDGWRNISFDNTFVLLSDETYNYTIRTGSYPQIIHKQNHTTPDGSLITCKEFIDANGKKYNDWTPAIKLFFMRI